ncbi:Lysozyme [Lysobacter dokdonensis DS-58]|uniref:Lysozyme n=1 Tax=Lysobacter dokdonensis DS-58 TaxID=1300345 RepID=A0A0A2X3S0_9GAMM|nr:Lysozyme [Lysobacter dokdonensis DS-58]
MLLLAAGLIRPWEGVRYTPYVDPVGVLTVCYGSTKNVDPNRKYTKAECQARLDADMREADAAVRRCVAREMPDGVRAALISLTFNVGPKPVCVGSPGKFARAGDWPNTCKSLELYKYAGGRVYRGLVLRRADERRVCEQGLR